MHVGRTCRPAYTAFFVSSKDFDGCNDAQHVFVDQIASVDVYEAIPVSSVCRLKRNVHNAQNTAMWRSARPA